MNGYIEFGYPWWLDYGHLMVAGCVMAILAVGRYRRWSRLPMLFWSAVALWSLVAFVAVRFVMNINGPAVLPTQNFLSSGVGRVLDLGAGTGRSSIMVLTERPRTTLVALDLFGESYTHHFGTAVPPQERLLNNWRVAGVEQRATIRTGDMRDIPFDPASFDAIVSAYAVDHLDREGVQKCLAEAARVLKPRGEFLLMLVGKDSWLKFTFGPLLAHGGFRDQAWWRSRLEEAGFQVVEDGMRPATLYLLARRI